MTFDIPNSPVFEGEAKNRRIISHASNSGLKAEYLNLSWEILKKMKLIKYRMRDKWNIFTFDKFRIFEKPFETMEII